MNVNVAHKTCKTFCPKYIPRIFFQLRHWYTKVYTHSLKALVYALPPWRTITGVVNKIRITGIKFPIGDRMTNGQLSVRTSPYGIYQTQYYQYHFLLAMCRFLVLL